MSKHIEEGKQTEQIAKIGDLLVEHVKKALEFGCKLKFIKLFIRFKLPKFHIYTRFVSSKRVGEEIVVEKMRTSVEFMNFLSVGQIKLG